MGRGAEFYRLDEVVVHVRVNARLQKGVERRSRRSTADEPSFEILGRRIGEFAFFPDIVVFRRAKLTP